MEIPTDKIKELSQTLLAIVSQIRRGKGCMGCDVLRNVEDENRYRLIGKWKSKNDCNNHLRSEEFSVLLGAMNLLQKRPEIRFDVVSSTKGIEEIHKARDEQKINNLIM
jgi:quinol monooxygenase YgiN